jgi:hypothetical protein
MSTLKSVGNKLFKTELATHNVELALVDDFKTELGKHEIALASYQDVIKEFDSIVSKDKTISNTLLNSLNDANSKYNVIYNEYITNLKKAESLKLDIENLGLKSPQDLENLIKANKTTSNDVSANIKNIKKIITTI